MPALRMFHGRGDDVLVEAEYERDDGSVRTVWLLYRFNGATLLEAISFPDEADARAYLPPPAWATCNIDVRCGSGETFLYASDHISLAERLLLLSARSAGRGVGNARRFSSAGEERP